jgi:hypothetical protein
MRRRMDSVRLLFIALPNKSIIMRVMNDERDEDEGEGMRMRMRRMRRMTRIPCKLCCKS